MDRVLNVEFGPLLLQDDDVASDGSYRFTDASNYRPLVGYAKRYWVSEQKLDLSGYTMDDLTVYFRNSFEQRSSVTSVSWQVDDSTNPLTMLDSTFLEATILTTVPMTDDNLAQAVLTAPGFIPSSYQIGQTGNFNRSQVIHGTNIWWGIDTTFGADVVTSNGTAYNRIIQSQDFSSLEPTASENIYCYRVLYFSASYTRTNEKGLTEIGIPAKRVILNCIIDEEPELEYMMRLKRSYELANQV